MAIHTAEKAFLLHHLLTISGNTHTVSIVDLILQTVISKFSFLMQGIWVIGIEI